MSTEKFYICRKDGNIISVVKGEASDFSCAGEKMEVLVPNTVDAAKEKHVPVVLEEGNKVTVTVGSTLHPMLQEHFIEWIYIETNMGNQIKFLKPGDKPERIFMLAEGEKLLAAYEYCNLHGLWKKEV